MPPDGDPLKVEGRHLQPQKLRQRRPMVLLLSSFIFAGNKVRFKNY